MVSHISKYAEADYEYKARQCCLLDRQFAFLCSLAIVVKFLVVLVIAFNIRILPDLCLLLLRGICLFKCKSTLVESSMQQFCLALDFINIWQILLHHHTVTIHIFCFYHNYTQLEFCCINQFCCISSIQIVI